MAQSLRQTAVLSQALGDIVVGVAESEVILVVAAAGHHVPQSLLVGFDGLLFLAKGDVVEALQFVDFGEKGVGFPEEPFHFLP